MIRRILTTCLMACIITSAWAAKLSKKLEITVGDETRSYWLYVPTGVKSNAPLVISLHGTSGHCEDKSPFRTDVADKYGCIVAYPQGESFYFPVFGGEVPGWHADGVDCKDIDFFKAIIEDVNSRYTIDRNRIYCCGFSNGGMMTYTVANVANDIFAAFASISGYPINEFHLHHTGRPVPFLHIHGKEDGFVRYALMPSIVDNNVARNGANPVPEKTSVSGKYDKSVYEATEGGFPYIYYEVDGMGHNDYTDRTEDGSSALTMWKFLSQYTLDSPSDQTLRWRPNLTTEGYVPSDHGFTYNPSSTTVLVFGKDQKTDANQNVYRSLQLEDGKYRMAVRADGPEEGKTYTVRLVRLGKTATILSKTVPVGQDVNIFFDVTGGWSEYKLTITHTRADGDLNISTLEIHTSSAEEEEALSIADVTPSTNAPIYDLAGRRLQHRPTRGAYIQQGHKVLK